MEFDRSRTPRELIRCIVENKLVSTHPRYRVKRKIRSPDDAKLQKQTEETSPTPRTLIRNVLKEKEANNSSLYIRRKKGSPRKYLDKEVTPFKRRAIARKRSLRSSKGASPEDKDVITSKTPKTLDIPSPPVPYMLRRFIREHATVRGFEHGVREIRHKRELATAASKANKQVKRVSSKDLSESVSGTETEVWDSEGRGADYNGNAEGVRSRVELAEAFEVKVVEGKQEEVFPPTTSEESERSLPETVIFESEVDREHIHISRSQLDEVELPPVMAKPREKEDNFSSLHPQDKLYVDVEMTSVKSNERLSPSEDEVPEAERSLFQALEVSEEDTEEEILPIQAKSINLPKRTTKKSRIPRLPSSLTKKLFQHFSGMRVSREALDAVETCCDAYFEQLTEDLLAYSNHAGRKTITPEDVELLLRRQNFITKGKSLYALVEEYLPLEYRQEIIPMAAAHNVIIPKK